MRSASPLTLTLSPAGERGSSARWFALAIALTSLAAHAQYRPADQGQRPAAGGTSLLPEQFLRGFDPISVYFPSDQVGEKANADDGAKRLKLSPDWPGAYVWVDKKTLQFRPAEPWPALARFSVEAGGARKILTTMMSAPVGDVALARAARACARSACSPSPSRRRTRWRRSRRCSRSRSAICPAWVTRPRAR